jgi:hypothetical protein
MRVKEIVIGLVIGCLALVATIAVQRHDNGQLRAENAKLALRNDSTAAALDTTRTITVALADSVHVLSQRRVVQTPQRDDAVDRALSLERAGRYALELRIDSLQRLVTSQSGVAEDTANRVRRALFSFAQAPYTIDAAVELPAPPDSGRMQLSIDLAPIPVVMRLSCATPNAAGVRSAFVEAGTPRWAALRFQDVQPFRTSSNRPMSVSLLAQHATNVGR